ncbi:actin-like ATPase domain-containing protein [Parathielavia hyrcaniae]|uniref:Actin-like ATPase domain-containing protein n=1 Tax=Parathielavia hyrcaniae TaxID=113614 RepID=A0AAN6T2A0_9PEZI|nr:actin-like ATPase domain-containing protein [Parathielavia hyrcaniae]
MAQPTRPFLTPLARLLAVLLLLVTPHALAASAVVGIDLGTEYIKAALVKPGIPLEIVLTKDSRRKEVSAVVFKPSPNGPAAHTSKKAGSNDGPLFFPERAYGSDAMALAPRFPGDVYPNLKSLLGLPVDRDEVREYASRHPALSLIGHRVKGTAAFKSGGAFGEAEEAWLVEELLAMELAAIRGNAEALAGSGSSVRSAVLTVPGFYTVEEKRAVQLAAELAGLKVLSLISDGLAVAVHYATSRQFPNVIEGGKPEYHMVFDMGAGSTKATVLRFQSRTVKDVGKFNKTVQEVQMVGSGWDRTLGGDALNYLIVDDMVAQFAASPKAKSAGVEADAVMSHGRTIAKLTKEAERVRHVLSANQNTQASFEGLYDDVDFKYKISRAEFEDMAITHAERVGVAVQNALTASGIELKELDSVILHGGASRTPFVQKQLERVLGGADKIRTNVNSDEAAVFGAGFRAAELSPSFRVKEIRVGEAAAYPIGMKWKTDEGKEKQQRLWTATSYLAAPAKEVTFTNQDDFSVAFYQSVPAPGSDAGPVDAEIKTLTTKNLTASVAELVEKHKCDKADIKLKMGARLASDNGEVDVTKVTVECEAETTEKEGFVDGVKNLFGFGKKEQQPLKDGESSSEEAEAETETSSSTVEGSTTSTSTSSASAASASESADSKAGTKKTHLVVIPVQFTLEKTGVPQLSKADLTAIKDRLKAFEASDRARRQREETLNQLEAYTYQVPELIGKEAFIAHSTAEERASLEKKNSDASEWLYGDGADASKEDFKAKLKELKAIVDPVQKRIDEAAKRPELVKNLQDALKSTKDFVADIKKKIAEHEAFQSSKSASSSSSTTDGETSTTTPPSSSASDFDGLEDEETTTTTTAAPTAMEDIDKIRGPVPPLYTVEDLRESDEAYASISAWLEEKLAAQEKLGATDDPVLLVKDLADRRERLDKVGMELAMKGVRNFEKNKKKDGSNKDNKEGNGKKKAKTKGSGGGSGTKTATGKPAQQTIKLGEDGKMPSQEELDELLREFMKEGEGGETEGKKSEEQQEQQEKKEGHDEL